MRVESDTQPAFKGVAKRGIYDNVRTAVDAVFVGKERQFNRRFAQMMSHPLVVVAALERLGRRPANVVARWSSGGVERFDGTD